MSIGSATGGENNQTNLLLLAEFIPETSADFSVSSAEIHDLVWRLKGLSFLTQANPKFNDLTTFLEVRYE